MLRSIIINSAFHQRPLLIVQKQQRGFATLKDISIRLKSIKNIQKITKSMKMVSAAKFSKAERELKGARVYGEGAQVFFNNVLGEQEVPIVTETGSGGSKRVLILMTSDRGLCGSVHTSIAKVKINKLFWSKTLIF